MNIGKTKKKATVLIVDDSALFRERIAEMLAPVDGLEIVGWAENAREAIRTFASRLPNLVILDIQMPGDSGLEVLRSIKHLWPETTVVVLTNHDEPQYRRRCQELRADYFLSKWAGASQLLEICTRLGTR